MAIYNNKEYHWICDTCKIDFNSRRQLKNHYKE